MNEDDDYNGPTRLSEEEFERLVTVWIELRHARKHTDEYESLFSEYMDLECDLDEFPEDIWRFILAVLAKDSSTKVVELLSAGELENLLADYGALFIERVEEEAKANPAFAYLLGGVWRSSISEKVWNRVLAVRDRRGWDGVGEDGVEPPQSSEPCSPPEELPAETITAMAQVWQKYYGTEKHSVLTDAESQLLEGAEMLWIQPIECWRFILEVMGGTPTIPAMKEMATGPLASLVGFNAEKTLHLIEQEAAQNPKIAAVLGGVLVEFLESPTRERVEAARDVEGWRRLTRQEN
jgi:hypothetical protein